MPRRIPRPQAVRSALFNVIERAARRAGRGLLHDFGEVEQLQVSLKGPGDFVSTADHQAEAALVEDLERVRPGYGFLLEEGGERAGREAGRRWIIDPLDGTTNFLHGIPHFAVSIALETEGEIVAGLIFDPSRDEMFYAEKGAGAFVNDRRLRVAGRRKLDESVIATGIPFRARDEHPHYLAMLEGVMGVCAGVRRFGSAALDLAWVAAGRFDGYFELGLSPWDVAAGYLIVREAGGFITTIDGGPDAIASGSVLAANPHLHAQLMPILGVTAAPR